MPRFTAEGSIELVEQAFCWSHLLPPNICTTRQCRNVFAIYSRRVSYQMHEWLNLAFRWTHVFAGILWIGQTYFFTWLDHRLHEEGKVWMVHSGGFYVVEKHGVDVQPPKLHRSEEHTSELQSQSNLVCRLLLEK